MDIQQTPNGTGVVTKASPIAPSSPGETRRRGARKLLVGLAVSGVTLLILEGLLRLCGYPQGVFKGAFSISTGIWEPGHESLMELGPFTYRVRTNSMGFRGGEFRRGLQAARHRVVCLGDSVTDGFYVDNEDTYPQVLEDLLVLKAYDVEVINAARGGGSVNKALLILRDRVLALQPDVAVLLFVTNDLADLRGRSSEELLSGRLQSGSNSSWIEMLLTRSAIGEVVVDVALRAWSKNYRRESRATSRGGGIDDRYRIEGGERYEDNARRFLEQWKDVDGRLLGASLDAETLQNLEVYCDVLRELVKLCHDNGIHLLFVYFPAYPEIYLAGMPTTFREVLRARVEAQGVEFLDLTPALREGSRQGPLHLAPIDFHPNPRGYRVVAEAVAGKLVELGWLDP